MSDAPDQIELRIQRLPHGEGLALPAYQTAGAAGLDLAAAVEESAPVVLAPGARALVPTGLAVAVPLGFEMQVRPRSGLAHRHGITGVLDAKVEDRCASLLRANSNLRTLPHFVINHKAILKTPNKYKSSCFCGFCKLFIEEI